MKSSVRVSGTNANKEVVPGLVTSAKKKVKKHAEIEDDPRKKYKSAAEKACSTVFSGLEVPINKAKPKQPPSAYVQWLREQGLHALRLKHPRASPAQLGKEAGELWLQLDPEVQAHYLERCEEAKEQWNLACRE